MPSPTFEYFEDVCNELLHRDEAVLPDDDFLSEERLRDLQDEHGGVAPDRAVELSLRKLGRHFKARGARVPFSCDLPSRHFRVKDRAFIDFVAAASSFRGLGKKSRRFEEATTERLRVRGAGSFHRVGWPRGSRTRRREFVQYLKKLGFNDKVAYGREKDGGLDIIWMLPLGAIPFRPIMSIQCKNGSFNLAQADQSNGSAIRSLGCHRGLQATVHTLAVVFNDYIDSLPPKPFNFVALGLSDLASPSVLSEAKLL